MYDIVHYRSDQLPPDLAVQIISFFRVLMMDEAKGDERFHDPFAHSDLFDHFMVVERGMMISHADVSFRLHAAGLSDRAAERSNSVVVKRLFAIYATLDC